MSIIKISYQNVSENFWKKIITRKKKFFSSSKFSILFFKLNYINIKLFIYFKSIIVGKKKTSIYNYSQILEILN